LGRSTNPLLHPPFLWVSRSPLFYKLELRVIAGVEANLEALKINTTSI
jgi:hypothetical protein